MIKVSSKLKSSVKLQSKWQYQWRSSFYDRLLQDIHEKKNAVIPKKQKRAHSSLAVIASTPAEIILLWIVRDIEQYLERQEKIAFELERDWDKVHPHCPLPFGKGCAVRLRGTSCRYVVDLAECNVDYMGATGHISPGYISSQEAIIPSQHYYRLLTPSGREAYWWHHQLEEIAS